MKKRVWKMSVKLCALALFTGLQCAVMDASAQRKISVEADSVTYLELFGKIREQTGLTVVYSNNELDKNKKVAARFVGEDIRQVMDKVLKGTGLGYDLEKELVVIKKLQQGNNGGTVRLMGRVVDSHKMPLPGVTVVVKGTSVGVATDVNGRFELLLEGENPVLCFSFIGMETKEVAVGDRSFVEIVLEEKVENLEEVVLTGYQTISKERSTGSYDMISKKDLDKPSTSIAQRLVGTVAGVNTSLTAEGTPSFVIRGQGTFLGSSPLVVVDGFVINGGFNSINPNDVESVTILKDAAAASIWGARASNGVIVVTTKKGKKNAEETGSGLDVQFSAFVKLASKTDVDYLRNQASSAETVEWEKMTFGKYGYTPLNSNSSFAVLKKYYHRKYTQGQILYNRFFYNEISEEEMNEGLERLSRLDNMKQIEEHLLRRPINQQYNLSLSGATDRMNNYVSLLYSRDLSRYQKDNDDAFQFDYRGRMGLAKWLDLNVAAMARYAKEISGGVNASTIQALGPYDMLLDEEGNYTDLSHLRIYKPMIDGVVSKESFPYEDWSYNPIKEMKNTKIQTKNIQARFQVGLTFKLLEGLTLDSKLQYELWQSDTRSLYNEDTYLVRSTVNMASTWNTSTGKITANLPTGSILDQEKTVLNTYNFRNQLNFNRTFADRHAVNFIVGLEISEQKNKGYEYPRSYGYDDKHLTVGIFPNGPGVGTTMKNWLGNSQTFDYVNKFSERTDRYFSVYGNVAYTYDDKYTVSGSVRTDASNFITDDPSYRYSPFWSVGVAWNMMREDFLQEPEWINLLRLRATYGFNGNSDNSTSVKPLISMNGYNGTTGELGAEIASKGNPLLRWERTGVFNLGTDFAFWNNKLYGKLDYYRKHGKDILAEISIPMVNGTDAAIFNNAEIINNGFEFELSSRQKVVGGLMWEGSVNFAYNHNKVKKLFRSAANYWVLVGSGGTMYVEGKPVNALYSYRYGGVRNVGTETDPRMLPVILLTEDNVLPITGTTDMDGLDFCEYQGTTVAPYTMGMSHRFTYKNFDLAFTLTGKFGHVFRRTGFNFPGEGAYPNKLLSEVMNADPERMVGLPERDTDKMWSSDMTGYMNYLTERANNVRLQELTLSYSLPRAFLSKIGFTRATVYVQGNHLFTIKGSKEDPEFLYARLRLLPSCTFGLRVGF